MQLADAGGGEVRVRHAPTLAAAREAVVRDRPDCVLLDLGLPDADGLDALDVLRAAAPGLPSSSSRAGRTTTSRCARSRPAPRTC